MIEEQDDVAQWVNDKIVLQGDSYLSLEDAFASFQQHAPGQLKNRQFQKRVSATLGPQVVYDNRAYVAPNVRKAAWQGVALRRG